MYIHTHILYILCVVDLLGQHSLIKDYAYLNIINFLIFFKEPGDFVHPWAAPSFLSTKKDHSASKFLTYFTVAFSHSSNSHKNIFLLYKFPKILKILNLIIFGDVFGT